MDALRKITEDSAECRYESAVYLKGGRFALISRHTDSAYRAGEYQNISKLLQNEPDGWTTLYFMHSETSKDYIVYAGETSFGGCGFVALLNRADMEFEWVIHFEDSNNFRSVTMKSGYIVATNNAPYPHSTDFYIDINEPRKIELRLNKNGPTNAALPHR